MFVLGRYDRVDLPDLGLSNIHAKIDTGAYSCSLHCQYATIVAGRLEFVLLDEEHPEFTGMKFTFDKYEERDIKNSFGETERRFVIETTITLFDQEFNTTFSLSNRGTLKFPVLIGRKLLRHHFFIDVSRKNQSYISKRRKERVREKNQH
jgi:hypothetical protein